VIKKSIFLLLFVSFQTIQLLFKIFLIKILLFILKSSMISDYPVQIILYTIDM